MSVATLPVYPDILSLSEEEITLIESSCVANGCLGKGEHLKDVVTRTVTLLKNNGLEKEDIYTNHRNMNLLFFHQHFEAIAPEELKEYDRLFMKIYDNYFQNAIIDGWSKKQTTYCKIKINGKRLIVCQVKWNGAKECPIEKHFDETKYHGSSSKGANPLSGGCDHGRAPNELDRKGDCDWFIYDYDNNQHLWVPDLLPAQIGMFVFQQGYGSLYRLNIEKYINVFNLTQRPSPIKYHYEIGWSPYTFPSQRKVLTPEEKSRFGTASATGIFIDMNLITRRPEMNDEMVKINNELLKDGKSICRELIDNDYYKAVVKDYEGKAILGLVITSESFIKNVRTMRLFGYPLRLDPDTRTASVSFFEISDKTIFLDLSN